VWRGSLRRKVLATVLTACVPAGVLRAQESPSEYEAKARFTVTLARFVQWPSATFAGDAAPLHLCVLHDSPALAAAFSRQEGVVVAGHPLSIVSDATRPGAGCDLLFVDASGARATAAALQGAADRPVLTLGAVDGFVSQGGMVELVNVNDALRFDVNLKALRSAHLGLSGQVLKLARQVRE
jgi:YfiR/HmsC-like